MEILAGRHEKPTFHYGTKNKIIPVSIQFIQETHTNETSQRSFKVDDTFLNQSIHSDRVRFPGEKSKPVDTRRWTKEQKEEGGKKNCSS